jgi:hypothetical protein
VTTVGISGAQAATPYWLSLGISTFRVVQRIPFRILKEGDKYIADDKPARAQGPEEACQEDEGARSSVYL